MQKEEERKDPLTGEVFTPKRSNQRFSCRENQIRFNNKKAKAHKLKFSEMHTLLQKNRDILHNIVQDHEQITESYDFLRGTGFNFGIQTHSIEHDGAIWTCIHDYAYHHIGKNKFTIIKY